MAKELVWENSLGNPESKVFRLRLMKGTDGFTPLLFFAAGPQDVPLAESHSAFCDRAMDLKNSVRGWERGLTPF